MRGIFPEPSGLPRKGPVFDLNGKLVAEQGDEVGVPFLVEELEKLLESHLFLQQDCATIVVHFQVVRGDVIAFAGEVFKHTIPVVVVAVWVEAIVNVHESLPELRVLAVVGVFPVQETVGVHVAGYVDTCSHNVAETRTVRKIWVINPAESVGGANGKVGQSLTRREGDFVGGLDDSLEFLSLGEVFTHKLHD